MIKITPKGEPSVGILKYKKSKDEYLSSCCHHRWTERIQLEMAISLRFRPNLAGQLWRVRCRGIRDFAWCVLLEVGYLKKINLCPCFLRIYIVFRRLEGIQIGCLRASRTRSEGCYCGYHLRFNVGSCYLSKSWLLIQTLGFFTSHPATPAILTTP